MDFAFLGPPQDRAVSFAAPGDGDGFLTRAADTLNPVADDRQKLADAYDRLIGAAAEETRLSMLLSSRSEALADAADNRIETARRLTGVSLENPFRQGYLLDATRRVDEARGRMSIPEREAHNRVEAVRAAQRDIFNERMDAAAEANPDKAAGLTFFQPLETQAGAIASNAASAATQARGEVAAAGGGPIGTFTSELLGGLWGARRDPVSLTSLVVGPTSAFGRGIAARVFTAGSAQGLFNIGLLALEKPEAQRWRAARGEEAGGMLPSVGEVGLAFALGFVPGAGIQGAIEVKGLGALRRLLAGEPKPGDVGPALRAMGLKDAEISALFESGLRSQQADGVVLAGRPEGVSADAHVDAARTALRHADNPVDKPPPAQAAALTAGASDEAASTLLERFKGNPLGAVEAMRGDRALAESALASLRPDLQAAGRLANLSDEAFALVRDGKATPEHGALVSELSPDPVHDAQVLDAVTRAQPADVRQAGLAAAEAIDGLSERAALERGRAEMAAAEPAPEVAPRGEAKDPINLVPLPAEGVGVRLVTRAEAARLGEHEAGLADLVRACK